MTRRSEPDDLVLPTPEATHGFGVALAGILRAGDLILLRGPLGAGKTVVAKGIGAGLGVRGTILSPTFVIARVHSGGRLPLLHVDAYRLGSAAEVDDLDLDAVVEDAVTVVEWGDGLVERLADAHLLVEIDRRPDDVRTARCTAYGGDWALRLQELDSVTSRPG